MYFLLPLSILTSLINLFLIKFIFKEKMIFERKISTRSENHESGLTRDIPDTLERGINRKSEQAKI